MGYHPAGNLTNDSYSPGSFGYTNGTQSRYYDAENRMYWALGAQGQNSTYGYDAEGHRVTRNVVGGNGVTWQIYGMGGELLAEYAAGAATFIPHEEDGYRVCQMPITAQNGDEGRLNRFVTWL